MERKEVISTEPDDATRTQFKIETAKPVSDDLHEFLELFLKIISGGDGDKKGDKVDKNCPQKVLVDCIQYQENIDKSA